MEISIDIETWGLDARRNSFICGVICKNKKNKIEKEIFATAKEMWERIIELGKIEKKKKRNLMVYHHSDYDFYGIFDRKDNKIEYHSFSPFIVTRENVFFIDTNLIFRGTVEELGNKIGLNKLERPKLLENKEKRKLSFEELNEIIKYCVIDAEIVLKGIIMLKEELRRTGINPRRIYTIGQLGMNYILKQLNKSKYKERLFKFGWKYELKETKNKEFIHKAYRGGIVKAWKRGIYKGINYDDINSSYPISATKIPFPDIETEIRIEKPLEYMKEKELLSKMGVSSVIISKTKDSSFGRLIIRNDDKNSDLIEHKSTLVGTWTNYELANAVNNGYRIDEIYESIIYEKLEENPLKEIYEYLYKNREGNPLKKQLYKGIMNMSIGKFGQRREKFHCIRDSNEEYFKYKEMGYEPIKQFGEDNLYQKRLGIQYPKFYCPIIPAYITAYSRERLIQAGEKIGRNNLIYADTDSLLHNRNDKVLKYSNNLGEWKREYENEEVIVYGKKDYAIGDIIKLSGFKKKYLTMEDFAKGKVKNIKKIGIKQAKNEEEIGMFIEEIVDLKKQKEEEDKRDKEILENKWFLDYDERNVFSKERNKKMKEVLKERYL